MIPQTIVQYLMENRVPFRRHWHTRAVSAQELAATLHVSGYRVAKSVIVQADKTRYIAVLPATEMLDETSFARAVGAREASLADESEFPVLFPECEVGAEPPFGGLYELPVVMDKSLVDEEPLVFRAGSHEETLEIVADDYFALESPIIASIGRREQGVYPSEPAPEYV
jgi:Ala-tRNA(Pro) deacylase